MMREGSPPEIAAGPVVDYIRDLGDRPVAHAGIQIHLVLRQLRTVKSPRQKNAAIHTWSEAEIAQFREHHPLGSTARTALELLIGTAQRRSDVVGHGAPASLRQRWAIYVKQQKTGIGGQDPD